MQRINPGSTWRQRLKQHIQSVNLDKQQSMGFPADWEQMAIWQEAVA